MLTKCPTCEKYREPRATSPDGSVFLACGHTLEPPLEETGKPGPDPNQVDLFGAPKLEPDREARARRSDPDTSKIAAKEMTRGAVGEDIVAILQAVSDGPERGMAYYEIEDAIGWERNKAARRLLACVQSDLLFRREEKIPSPAGRPCHLHRITVRGLEYLRDFGKTPAIVCGSFGCKKVRI